MLGLNLNTRLVVDRDLIQAPDLTDRFDAEDLSRIGSYVWEGYVKDKASRVQWERRMQAAMALAMQVQEVKTFPWPGSSNVVFPLVTIAGLQFSSRAYTNIIQGTDIVRYRTAGPDPQGKLMQRAQRISSHMSWQVLEEDEAWEEQHDRLFINVAIVGSAFIKTFFDAGYGHNVSEFVPAADLVVDYWAKSIEAASRKTQRIALSRNDIYESIMEGSFRDVRDTPMFNAVPSTTTDPKQDTRRGQAPPASDQATPYQSLEQHCFFDFDGDGYYEPYVVTVDETSKMVLRIKARFGEEQVQKNIRKEIVRIQPIEYFTKYSFIPSPDGSVYDMGLGAFLGPINEAVDTGVNQLFDSGTLQNSMGGFLGRGAKIRGGNYTMAPFEWKRVDSTGDDLRKHMVPYPERQPSEVLLKLVMMLIEYAERIAGTTEEQLGGNPGQNTPASTYRGMLEQGAQVPQVIFKRIWRSMKEEFRKLYLLNRDFVRVRQAYGSTSDRWIAREDYLGTPDRIAPVADPNITSTTMRVQQAMTLRQLAHSTQGYDRDEVENRVLRAIQVDDPERVYLGEAKGKPLPNPKAAAEQIKAQVAMQKQKLELQSHLLDLKANRILVLAQAHNYEAQAAKTLKEADVVGAAEKLKAFEQIVDMYNAEAERRQAEIDKLEKMYGNDQGDQGGGMGSVEGQSGDEGGDEVPGNSPMEPAESVGGGSVSEQ